MDFIIKNILGQGSINSYCRQNKDEEKERFFQDRFPINGFPANIE